MKGKDKMEIWKDIVGYEGLYQVSSLGRVRSLDRTIFTSNGPRNYKGKMLKPCIDSQNKYYYVYLCGKHFSIHRLVAEAFIPNPEGKETVNHINEKKDDNRVENLEWMTYKENLNYGERTIKASKSRGKPVVCIETGIVYFSGREAQRQTGIDQSTIGKVCRNTNKDLTAGGYHWKFVED